MAFYLINAHERFGGWWDNALWRWFQVDAPALGINPHWGPFSLHYLPYNLYTAFFMAPSFGPEFPWIFPTPAGQSILTTSPAFILALRSVDRSHWYLTVASVLAMAGALTVYGNGMAQLGYRYGILAYPFLLLLMAEKPLDRLGKILIVASVMLTAYEIWVVRYLQLF